MTPLEKRLQQVIEKKADAHYLDRLGDDQARHSYLTGASLLAPLLVRLEGSIKALLEDCEHPYACSCMAKAEESAKKSLSSFEKFLDGGGDE